MRRCPLPQSPEESKDEVCTGDDDDLRAQGSGRLHGECSQAWPQGLPLCGETWSALLVQARMHSIHRRATWGIGGSYDMFLWLPPRVMSAQQHWAAACMAGGPAGSDGRFRWPLASPSPYVSQNVRQMQRHARSLEGWHPPWTDLPDVVGTLCRSRETRRHLPRRRHSSPSRPPSTASSASTRRPTIRLSGSRGSPSLRRKFLGTVFSAATLPS